MRILLLHNSYQEGQSGEFVVFASEKALLESRGHDVAVFEKFNDDIPSFSPWRKLSLLWETSWSQGSYDEVRQAIRHERPEVAHFHNTLPLISPSAYYACRDEGVPVVQTLHNYRVFCAAGILMRSGRACVECLHRGPWHAVRYGCYRGSRIETAAIAYMNWSHRRRGTWTEQIDAYIALTEFSRRKFVEAGLPAHKIFMKPNSLSRDTPVPGTKGNYAIYMGRLSPNKGVRAMLAAWRDLPGIPLTIVGDGELRAEMEGVARDHGLDHVTFLGHQAWERCMELLGGASFLVLPSEHHEGLPCVVAEAFSLGKPILASRQDPLPELIRDGETGLLFDTGCPSDLAEKARLMVRDAARIERLGSAAREEYEAKYTPERSYRTLMQVYESAIAAGKRRSRS